MNLRNAGNKLTERSEEMIEGDLEEMMNEISIDCMLFGV